MRYPVLSGGRTIETKEGPMLATATRTYRFGGIDFPHNGGTLVMGILNVTPDSFADGGRFLDPDDAVRHGLALIDEGADCIDVGGESTRPGSDPVPAEEELRRILPVITALAARTRTPISVDTWKADVAARALEAGATIVNDISGLRFDPLMAETVARFGASAVLMHIRGTPRSMQEHPAYRDVVAEVLASLQQSAELAHQHGINAIAVDPGIGFGKTGEHNLEILGRLGEFRQLGYPVLVGVSRKSFIGNILNLPAGERLEGTLAAVAAAILHGADIVRVHDVRAVKRVAAVIDAIRRHTPGSDTDLL